MIALGIINLPLFMLAVLLLNVTLGSDVAYAVGHSVSQGRAAGLLLSLEVSVGRCVYMLTVAFGLTALLTASIVAFTVIKVVDTMYLIYLGGRMPLAPPEHGDATVERMETPTAKHACPFGSLFMQGLLTNALSPKVVPFFLSFFPQSVDPPAAHKTLALLVLGAVPIVMSTIWNNLAVWVATSVTCHVAGKSGIRRWLDCVAGATFIDLGVRLALTTR